MSTPLVLALDVSGTPRDWLNYEQAIVYHAKSLVAWSLGETITTFRGGFRNLDGQRSTISTQSIIAIKGSDFNPKKFNRVALTNDALFARDRNVCAYCANVYGTSRLSRDHVHPTSRGGLNVWTNAVTACKPCNARKGDQLLSECGMKLIYVPYEPNHNEAMILRNRRILADQMEYLLAGVPKNSRIHESLAEMR